MIRCFQQNMECVLFIVIYRDNKKIGYTDNYDSTWVTVPCYVPVTTAKFTNTTKVL